MPSIIFDDLYLLLEEFINKFCHRFAIFNGLEEKQL